MKPYWKFWLAGLIVLAVMVVGYELAAAPHSNHDHQHEHHQHN